MRIESSVTLKLPDVDRIKKGINQYKARVGVLGGDATRTEGDTTLNNAEIGFIQQFGSVTHKIPPRDFLIMPIKVNARSIINGLKKSTKIKKSIELEQFKKAVTLLGIIAEGFVKTAFTNAGFGQWAPNAPSTIAKKGSSAPLVDSGQLARAISSDVVGR